MFDGGQNGTLGACDLDAALRGANSATAVLEELFGAPLMVRRLPNQDPRTTPKQLTAGGAEAMRHRRVELIAGDRVVSEAELWYVANRLPKSLVEKLETTAIPFGRVMQPLGLRRWLFSARFAADLLVALEHRALLSFADGLAVAEVVERYPRTLFGCS